MSPATRSLPCMKADVPSSSPLIILSKVSRLTVMVQSADLPSPSVTVFGTEVRCVALRAGDEKYVIQSEHGPDWLVERGLDRKTAERLVNDAMNQPEE